MAEPSSQAGSIARQEDTGGPPERPRGVRALLAWLKLDGEPSEMAPALRVLLIFLKEVGAKQIEQVPGLGPLISALLQLSAEEDSTELDSQVAEILETGRQSRETLDALGALATAIYLEQRALRERLESEGLTVRPEQITSVALSTALAAYRGRVARDYQYADYRGIEGGTRAEHVASLPLDEVYVLPRLVPERSQIEGREREARLLKDLLDNEDLSPVERIQREEEFALLTSERWRAIGEKEQAKAICEAFGQIRHAVVIGRPGVGKSAMTRYLARTCALGTEVIRGRLGWDEDLTPVVLPLAGYADAKSRRPGLMLREHLDTKLAERGGDALREALDAELRAGRALVLFDGVDEIPDSRERILVVKAVDQFLADHATNRFIVTSRPYGYVRLAGEIPHFQLPNFSPKQVEEFVRRWQKAFERWRHLEAPDFAQAEKQADDMLKEIRRNPKVEELATNPLMLVIFALIRHEQTRLPEERVQLYNRAVNTLMDSWNRGRSLDGIDVGGARLPLEPLVRVWSAVAEWTRRTKPTGVVHRAALKTKLIEVLHNEELDEEDPEATTDSYLNAAADRAGLLEERGKDIFAFWHSTFEEFLAAVELTTPSAKAIDRILPLRDDPRWREVILLAVGYLGIIQRDRETATELVRAIWERERGPLEPLLHSHLRLAAACVADDLGVKRSLKEDIVVALGEVVGEFPYNPFVRDFVATVRGVHRLRPSPSSIRKLEVLASHPDPRVRTELGRIAGNVAAEDHNAYVLCEKLFKDSEQSVRSQAAFGLIKAGMDSVEAWAAVSKYRESHFKGQFEAWIVTIDPSRIRRFLDLLLRSQNPELRWNVASLLRALPGGFEVAMEYLSEFLEDIDCRWKVASVLRTLGAPKEQVFSLLEPLLISAEEQARWRAADILRSMECYSTEVLPALEPLLDSPDPNFRLTVASAWISVGGDSARVIDALVPILQYSDPTLLLRAADVWLAFPEARGPMLSSLEPLLESPNDALRSDAESAWRRMGGDPARVRPTLRAEPRFSLSEDDDQALSELSLWLKRGGPTALVASQLEPHNRVLSLLERLLGGPDLNLRLKAAGAWLMLGGEREIVTAALVSQLSEGDLRWKIWASELVFPVNPMAAIESLTRDLSSKPWCYLSACHKLLDGQSLDSEDGQNLSELVRVDTKDTDDQRLARARLFTWLYGRLLPQDSSPVGQPHLPAFPDDGPLFALRSMFGRFPPWLVPDAED